MELYVPVAFELLIDCNITGMVMSPPFTHTGIMPASSEYVVVAVANVGPTCRAK